MLPETEGVLMIFCSFSFTTDPAGDDNPTVTLAPALLEAVKKVAAPA